MDKNRDGPTAQRLVEEGIGMCHPPIPSKDYRDGDAADNRSLVRGKGGKRHKFPAIAQILILRFMGQETYERKQITNPTPAPNL